MPTELQRLLLLKQGLHKKLEKIEDEIEKINLEIDKIEEHSFA